MLRTHGGFCFLFSSLGRVSCSGLLDLLFGTRCLSSCYKEIRLDSPPSFSVCMPYRTRSQHHTCDSYTAVSACVACASRKLNWATHVSRPFFRSQVRSVSSFGATCGQTRTTSRLFLERAFQKNPGFYQRTCCMPARVASHLQI